MARLVWVAAAVWVLLLVAYAVAVWRDSHSKLKLVHEVVGFFAAGVFAVLGLGFTLVQLHGNSRTSGMEARPWVGISLSSDHAIDIKPGRPVRWHATINNYGDLPASSVKWRIRLFFVRSSPNFRDVEASIDHLALEEDRQKVLFQRQTAPDMGSGDEVLSPADVTAIQNGTYHLILGGKVSFVDTNFHGHSTTFCAQYEPASQDGWPSFAACPLAEKLDGKVR